MPQAADPDPGRLHLGQIATLMGPALALGLLPPDVTRLYRLREAASNGSCCGQGKGSGGRQRNVGCQKQADRLLREQVSDDER